MDKEILKLSHNRNYLGCNMEWAKEQITNFQMQNSKELVEINSTLRPDGNLSGKIGIALPGQNGDLMTAMSVLKYRDQIFPGKEIVWFANFPNADALRYAPVSEVRPWPWPGNGLPTDAVGDFYPMLCTEDNRLNKELAKSYELTADLEEMFFPAPWMLSVPKRHGLSYPDCSKKVFGIPNDYPWHPVLSFSDEEREAANDFINKIPDGKKVIIETFAGSGQSLIDESMITSAMNRCNEIWGQCNFIFASHKFLRANEKFPEFLFDEENIFSCANFSVRQCALIAEQTDLMISVSSGITVSASAWGIKSPPTLQFCGSRVCSTKTLSNGRFELVTADNKSLDESKNEFMAVLSKLLNELK